MTPQAQRGFTLPLALFALVILVSSIRMLSVYGAQATEALKIGADGDREYERIKEQISRSLPTGGGCARLSHNERVAVVCADLNIPWRLSPSYDLPAGTVDYDSVFRNTTTCAMSIAEATPTTPLPPLSARTCPLSGVVPANITRQENIEGRNLSLVVTTNVPSVLASPGRVRVLTRLTISSDLVVVAGGDVFIERLESSSTDQTRVSIFSSLGDITVGSIAPNIALFSAGRRRIEVPPSPQSLSYPLPPFRGRGLRGFELLD